jgi:hypothetical protein
LLSVSPGGTQLDGLDGDFSTANPGRKVRRQIRSLPKILALGIMLLETEKGRAMETYWKDFPQFLVQGLPTTNCKICLHLIKETKGNGNLIP